MKPEEIASLNWLQTSGRVHPMTCGNCAKRSILVATDRGWECSTPGCGYVQAFEAAAKRFTFSGGVDLGDCR